MLYPLHKEDSSTSGCNHSTCEANFSSTCETHPHFTCEAHSVKPIPTLRVKPILAPRVKPTQAPCVKSNPNQGERLTWRVKTTPPALQWKQMPDAVGNFLRDWQMNVPEDQNDPQTFLANARLQIHRKLVEEIRTLNGVKFQLLLENLLYKQTTEGFDKWNEPTLRSEMKLLLTEDEISESLDRELQQMLEKIQRFTKEGTNGQWIHMVQLHIAQYQQIHGGSYFSLPKEVQAKKASSTLKTKTKAVYNGLYVWHSTLLIKVANTQNTMDCVAMVLLKNSHQQIDLVQKQIPNLP